MGQMKKNSGFTLVELMVTIAVLAVITSIAVPSFSSLMQSNRIAATTQNIHSTLMLARSEAVKRNQAVSVCRANNDQDACATSQSDWDSGWLVIVGSEVLKIGTAGAGIEVTGPNTAVDFFGSGMARTTYEFTIKGKDRTKKLCISRSGTIKEATAC